MYIKPGVRLVGMKPEMFFALQVADNLAIRMQWHALKEGLPIFEEPVLTSGVDGAHSYGSLHYSGNAADLRSHHYNADQIVEFVRALSERLGQNYDVVAEEDHIHLEYQPKGKING